MELRLKTLLEQAQFSKYKGKGYDAAEVDDFLDRATAMAAKVETQLTESMGHTGSGGAPGPTNAEVQAEVNRRVEARLAELRDSGEQADGPVAAPDTAAAERAAEEAAEQAHRTLLLAQRTADSAVREAREEAEKLLGDARERSTTAIAEADAHGARLRADGQAEALRERQEARRQLGEEIHQLEAVREALRSDVEVLERHVAEQRGRLGSSIAELQRLVDDPASFRLAPTPDLIDPDVPELPRDDSTPEPEPVAGEDRGDSDVTSKSGADDPTPAPDQAPAGVTGPTGRSDDAGEGRSGGSVDPTDRAGLPNGGQAPSGSGQPGSGGPRAFLRGGTAEQFRAEGSLLTANPSAGVLISDVDHQIPGQEERFDSGPLTSPTPVVDLDLAAAEADPSPSDDAFLAELRKAMADEQPLGPRPIDPADQAAMFGEDRPSRRFGRRR